MPCAVLFDWDGTLADTRQVVVATFQSVVRDMGISIPAEFIERRIGTGAKRTFEEIFQEAKKPYDEALIRRLLAKKIETEISMNDSVKLFPGAKRLLTSLKKRTRVALASMNNRAVIENLLDTMKIGHLFEVVLTVEEVSKFKPDPEIFLKCAAKLQCNPKGCVVVEDSIFGVQAAKAARMSCVAVLTGVYSRKELEEAKPGLIVKSLAEKEQIFNFIFQ